MGPSSATGGGGCNREYVSGARIAASGRTAGRERAHGDQARARIIRGSMRQRHAKIRDLPRLAGRV